MDRYLTTDSDWSPVVWLIWMHILPHKPRPSGGPKSPDFGSESDTPTGYFCPRDLDQVTLAMHGWRVSGGCQVSVYTSLLYLAHSSSSPQLLTACYTNMLKKTSYNLVVGNTSAYISKQGTSEVFNTELLYSLILSQHNQLCPSMHLQGKKWTLTHL